MKPVIMALFDKSPPAYHADTKPGFKICEQVPFMVSSLVKKGSLPSDSHAFARILYASKMKHLHSEEWIVSSFWLFVSL